MKYKLETIKRQKDFDYLFANGKRFSEGNLRLVVLPKSENEIENEPNKIFYAVQVSKKATKKAVVRNRIKRLLRESLRFIAKSQMSNMLSIFKYIFLGWVAAPQRACDIHLNDVLPSVQKAISVAYFFFVSQGTRQS
ncbi:MAG: ribonuclease P protein component [Ignavibacteria bacterium]|nr:ribonuclease P protein component [Ignavibacteria bacterium]